MLRLGLMPFAAAVFLLALAVPQANAENAASGVKCKKAEVNPVSGFAICVDPVGAPVAQPKAGPDAPCKGDPHAGGDWTFGPKCASHEANSNPAAGE